MKTVRPLIVDDSVVVRNTLREVFRAVPEIGECAVAADGRIALELIPQIRPGVIILDLEMPRLNGLETLQALQRDYPDVPVIVFSSLTETGARETIQALATGAADYVTKPPRQKNLPATIERIRDQLIPKIRAICAKRPTAQPTVRRAIPPVPASTGITPPQLLVVGSSTGGPAAVERLLTELPSDFPAPIIIAQHMPPVFTARLADRLDELCAISVREVTEPCELRSGSAYLGAGTGHIRVFRQNGDCWCRPVAVEHGNTLRPSVDLLFETAAGVCGSSTLALVLSGMGRDGERGCEFVRDAGGYVIAQDEASSVVWGMPGAVVRAGLANEIVRLSEIGAILNSLTTASAGPGRQAATTIRHDDSCR